MTTDDIRHTFKAGVKVKDTLTTDFGIGEIVEQLKTRIKVKFGEKVVTYDFPHIRICLVIYKEN